MKTRTIYIAKDWKEFNSEQELKNYEKLQTPDKIRLTTYLHKDKWEVFKELTEEWYEFNDEIRWNLKYILNEVEVIIDINSKTWEYKIVSLN